MLTDAIVYWFQYPTWIIGINRMFVSNLNQRKGWIVCFQFEPEVEESKFEYEDKEGFQRFVKV